MTFKQQNQNIPNLDEELLLRASDTCQHKCLGKDEESLASWAKLENEEEIQVIWCNKQQQRTTKKKALARLQPQRWHHIELLPSRNKLGDNAERVRRVGGDSEQRHNVFVRAQIHHELRLGAKVGHLLLGEIRVRNLLHRNLLLAPRRLVDYSKRASGRTVAWVEQWLQCAAVRLTGRVLGRESVLAQQFPTWRRAAAPWQLRP